MSAGRNAGIALRSIAVTGEWRSVGQRCIDQGTDTATTMLAMIPTGTMIASIVQRDAMCGVDGVIEVWRGPE